MNVVQEVSTSKLVKQLQDVGNKFTGDGAEEGPGHADVRLVSLNVMSQVFHAKCLEGHLICKKEGGVCFNCHEKGTGKARVIKNEAMGVKSAGAGGVVKAMSVGDSASGRHVRIDVVDRDGLSSGGKGFGVSLLILCSEEVCCMFKVCLRFP